MSEFHYVRTLGGDGGVDACNGPAIGLDLETVLEDGLPPWNIALEIVAALCEILEIAEEDGEVHGDISPRFVFIDETGAVSLEGFGLQRTRTRAPEAAPRGHRTDLYGLGYTAFRLICSFELPELPNDDPDAHDDAIIDAALEIDLDAVPDEMQGDIQWFVAKLMSFDREDRPSALEAWRTFVAFASEISGPDMVAWCGAALDGGGERRRERSGGAKADPQQATEAPPDEDLGGPVMQKGPLSGGGLSFGDPSSGASRGATAFWTRDAMKAALDAAPEDEEVRPAVGGGAATSFWTKEQMAAMASGSVGAPRPRRAQGEGERRRATAAQKVPDAVPAAPGPAPAPPADPPTAPPHRAASASPPPPPKTPLPDAGPPAPTPAPEAAPASPPPAVAQGPVASPAATAPAPAAVATARPPTSSVPPGSEEGGGRMGMLVLLGGLGIPVLLGLGLVALLLVVGVAWWLSTSSVGAGSSEAPALVAPEPDPSTDGGTPEEGPEATPEPEPDPQPAPKPSSTPKPAPQPSASPKPAPAPAPAPRPRPRRPRRHVPARARPRSPRPPPSPTVRRGSSSARAVGAT